MPLKIDGVEIIRLYDKNESAGETSATEIFKLEDQGEVVFRRPLIIFNLGYTSSNYSTQRKTYGVEQITNPGSPSRSGSYYFTGWYTTATGSVKVSFPVTVPNIDSVTYYAQWKVSPTATKVTASADFNEMAPGDGARFLYIYNPNSFAVRVSVYRYFNGGYVDENLADSERNIDIGAKSDWSGLYFRTSPSTPYYFYIYQQYSPSAGNNGIGSSYGIHLKSSNFVEYERTD